jgi:predicted ferric reductase
VVNPGVIKPSEDLHVGPSDSTQYQRKAMSQLTAARSKVLQPAIPAVLSEVWAKSRVGLLWVVFGGNAAAITAIWLADGGASGVVSLGTALQSAGRLTGFLAGYFVLIQVVLLARLPWLEQLVGFDRLTVWHRRNGKLSLYLVLAHVVFITAGYTMVDGISLPSEISQFLTFYPWMIAAVIGTILMILVVVASLVIVRRRLRYELWYLVHLSAYLAIALAWFHQVPTGFDLVTHPRAAIYWTSLYVATLAVLVAFRLVQPSIRAWQRGLRVSQVTTEAPDVVSVVMTGRRLDRMQAKAGQFMLFRFLDSGRWWESHPFSLSALPSQNALRITVKGVGDFTKRMPRLAPGTRVLAEGPFGVFTDEVRTRERALLVAGGIGITPIRCLMEEMARDVVVIYRTIREEDIIFRQELDDLARRRAITLVYVLGDHTAPGASRLLSTEHLLELVPDIAEREVYLCGPPAMTEVIERNITRAGTPRRFIHAERFAL